VAAPPGATHCKTPIYTLLFSLSIVGLISLFKDSARTVDLENHRAALAAAERAATDAVESERARIDALVHDKVLTALLVAASSDSKETQDAAAELSKTAIASLENLESETASDTRVITVNSLFRALKDAVARLDNQIEIHIDNSSDQTIDPHVADALTEATIQAVNNSLLHAGAQAKRGLKMRTNKDKLKIVIYDTGRGFRVGRIPKNRLGLRLSIIDRVEKVGGRVFIDSRPGDGTNIILEWGPK
jgi:signal transduction histidine kinase